MSAVLVGYSPPRELHRALALSVIGAVHAAVIVAWLALGGAQVVLRQAEPLLVQLVEQPPRPAIEIPRAVPLPAFRTPDIKPPQPPPIENLFAMRPDPTPVPTPPAPLQTQAPPPVAVQPVAAGPVLEPPRADMAYLNNPPPAYPQASRRAGEQGRVLLRVHVTPEGEPDAIEVHQSSGFERLDEAARAAVRRWRFAAAKLSGRAVAGWALVPVNFSLQR